MLISIKIAGPAGFGIKVTGITLAKTFLRSGYHVFGYTAYPSLIRGGHNTYQVDVSNKKINSSTEKVDVLILLDEKSFELEKEKIKTNGVVICDESISADTIKGWKKKKVNIVQMPLVDLAKQQGSDLMKNSVALGALMKILDMPLENLNSVLKTIFANKKDMATNNVAVAKAGYKHVAENFDENYNLEILPSVKKKGEYDLLMSGNQACAMGVIASGCQVFVAYPMTPSTDILHILEAKQKETGMIIHQPEDEIAGIHAAIGASFAGARSATGTSGGGFALMNEGFSLAGMTETPLVVFEVQRPAPATGNPTWSDQGDLSFVVNAGHGEFARIVIAPGTPEQCFDLVQHAFNLAEKYQTPVIILSDKHLGESVFSVDADVFNDIDKKVSTLRSINYKSTKLNDSSGMFKRYKLEKDGVSERTIPGMLGGEHVANSDEHDEYGYSNEASQVRHDQTDKRMKKLEGVQKEIPLPKIYGPRHAKNTLVCWGSTFGAAFDTVQKAKDVNMIHFEFIYPMPKNLDKFLNKFKNLILVEQNKTGQLGKLIRQETGIEIKKKILKYNSRPFWNGEIESKLKLKK